MLKEKDHDIVCLVRKSSDIGDLEDKVTVVHGDVTDKPSIVSGMRGCEWVIHLANVYSFWEPDKSVYKSVNVNGTRNVMEAAIETVAAKIVHVSSVVTYGRPDQLPFTEETPEGLSLFSEYARTKSAADALVWKLYKNQRLPVVMVYPGAVAGPGDLKASGQYIHDLINRRLPMRVYDNSILTWVHVRDVSTAIVKTLELSDNLGERYLICSEQVTNREFTNMVAQISGVPSPRIRLPDFLVSVNAFLLTALAKVTRQAPPWGMSMDQMNTLREGIVADGAKAKRELGIVYTPLYTALEEAIEWYRQELAVST
tara:strand:- start:8869 stop:9807 length:939 start_codon:yes stop_codon:yes gene_type:complete